MTELQEGDRVTAVRTIHRSTGSAWKGARGRVVRVDRPWLGGAELIVEFEDGFRAEQVRLDEVEFLSR